MSGQVLDRRLELLAGAAFVPNNKLKLARLLVYAEEGVERKASTA